MTTTCQLHQPLGRQQQPRKKKLLACRASSPPVAACFSASRKGWRRRPPASRAPQDSISGSLEPLERRPPARASQGQPRARAPPLHRARAPSALAARECARARCAVSIGRRRCRSPCDSLQQPRWSTPPRWRAPSTATRRRRSRSSRRSTPRTSGCSRAGALLEALARALPKWPHQTTTLARAGGGWTGHWF